MEPITQVFRTVADVTGMILLVKSFRDIFAPDKKGKMIWQKSWNVFASTCTLALARVVGTINFLVTVKAIDFTASTIATLGIAGNACYLAYFVFDIVTQGSILYKTSRKVDEAAGKVWAWKEMRRGLEEQEELARSRHGGALRSNVSEEERRLGVVEDIVTTDPKGKVKIESVVFETHDVRTEFQRDIDQIQLQTVRENVCSAYLPGNQTNQTILPQKQQGLEKISRNTVIMGGLGIRNYIDHHIQRFEAELYNVKSERYKAWVNIAVDIGNLALFAIALAVPIIPPLAMLAFGVVILSIATLTADIGSSCLDVFRKKKTLPFIPSFA